MTLSVLSVLLVITVGAMTGAGIGLGIGFVAGQQKAKWSDMTGKEKTINIILVAVFSVLCISVLAWYALLN